MTDEKVFNEMNCFAVNGTEDNIVDIQAILPDLTGFELKGNEKMRGCDCEKWQKKEEIGQKLNKYTMWLKVKDGVAIPHHYEMKGFNSLLGSHYDHYYLDYLVSIKYSFCLSFYLSVSLSVSLSLLLQCKTNIQLSIEHSWSKKGPNFF